MLSHHLAEWAALQGRHHHQRLLYGQCSSQIAFCNRRSMPNSNGRGAAAVVGEIGRRTCGKKINMVTFIYKLTAKSQRGLVASIFDSDA